MFAGNPTDSKIDRWLRRKPPHVELALRYCLRARLRNGDRTMTARIDELFAKINPTEDELAAIVRQAREIGQVLDGEIGPAAPRRRQR